MSDLTTFATEGIEQNALVDRVLEEAERLHWIERFPDGELTRDTSYDMGRDSFECLVVRDARPQVINAFKEIRYVIIEGE